MSCQPKSAAAPTEDLTGCDEHLAAWADLYDAKSPRVPTHSPSTDTTVSVSTQTHQPKSAADLTADLVEYLTRARTTDRDAILIDNDLDHLIENYGTVPSSSLAADYPHGRAIPLVDLLIKQLTVVCNPNLASEICEALKTESGPTQTQSPPTNTTGMRASNLNITGCIYPPVTTRLDSGDGNLRSAQNSCAEMDEKQVANMIPSVFPEGTLTLTHQFNLREAE